MRLFIYSQSQAPSLHLDTRLFVYSQAPSLHPNSKPYQAMPENGATEDCLL
jgi:hypothetical protein